MIKPYFKLLRKIRAKSDDEIASDYRNKLKKIGVGEHLLPDIPCQQKLIGFIWNIAALTRMNEYLYEVIKRTRHIELTDNQIETVYDAVIIAWLCDQISVARLTDSRRYKKIATEILRAKRWTRRFKILHRNPLEPFTLVKHLTMDIGQIHEMMFPWFHDKIVMPGLLNLNILEAVIQSLISGDQSYKSGIALLLNPIIRTKYSKDVSKFYMQNTTKWNDLYVIWNMAFITNLSSFGHIFGKLIYPSLIRYRVDGSSGLFIRSRAASLQAIISLGAMENWDSPCHPDVIDVIQDVATSAAIDYAHANVDSNPSLYNRLVYRLTKRICK